ncbi:hypothetical protein ACOME3_002699 [Neoechinorhynchus agilis]
MTFPRVKNSSASNSQCTAFSTTFGIFLIVSMAVGKSKKGASKGTVRKGGKRKVVDPFTRKDWYDLKVPSMFKNRVIGKTLVNRTTGTKIASEALKGRVVEVSLGDLDPSASESAFRKFRFVVEEVQGRNCLMNFHGMEITRDMLCQKIRKRYTMIEAHSDARTTDGYVVRLFAIGFTTEEKNRRKLTCYANHSQIKNIRRRMVDVMNREVSSTNLRGLVVKLIPDTIAQEIETSCRKVRPIRDIYIRKVKVIKKPKFDLKRLLYMHGEAGGQTAEVVGDEEDEGGVRIESAHPGHYEPPIMADV